MPGRPFQGWGRVFGASLTLTGFPVNREARWPPPGAFAAAYGLKQGEAVRTRGSATFAIVLLLGAASAGAEGAGSLEAYGRHLASECTACHRSDGVEPGIPPLAGRAAADLIDLLRSYRERRRTNPVMVSVARSLDERQSAALAAYFASLPRPVTGTTPQR